MTGLITESIQEQQLDICCEVKSSFLKNKVTWQIKMFILQNRNIFNPDEYFQISVYEMREGPQYPAILGTCLKKNWPF